MMTSIERAALACAALTLTAATPACSPEAPPEPRGSTSARQNNDAAIVDSNTVYLKAGPDVVYTAQYHRIFVCDRALDDETRARVHSLTGTPHVILEKEDGSMETRLSDAPQRFPNATNCDGGEGWDFFLKEEDDGSFLRTFDLSGEMVHALAGQRFGCEGGFQLHHDINIQGFSVENGVLRRPDITFTLEGSGVGRAQCRLAVSRPGFVMAGPVPVYYELQALVALEVSVSKSTTFRTTFGTRGGQLETDDIELGITPQIEFGVTFYKSLGVYVGADFPFTFTPQAGCSPRVEFSVALKAGAQAGLLGAGVSGSRLTFTKALGAEINTEVVGPFVIAEPRCEAPAPPPDPNEPSNPDGANPDDGAADQGNDEAPPPEE